MGPGQGLASPGPKADLLHRLLGQHACFPTPPPLYGRWHAGRLASPLCKPEPRAGLRIFPLAVALRVAADTWACPAEYSCFAIYQFLFEKSTELCSCVMGLSGGSFSPFSCPAVQRGPRLWCPVLTSREAGVPRGPWPGRAHDAVFHGSPSQNPCSSSTPTGPGPYLGPSPFSTPSLPPTPPQGRWEMKAVATWSPGVFTSLDTFLKVPTGSA